MLIVMSGGLKLRRSTQSKGYETAAQGVLFPLLLSVAEAPAGERGMKLPPQERQRRSVLSDLMVPKRNPEIQTTGDILVRFIRHCECRTLLCFEYILTFLFIPF